MSYDNVISSQEQVTLEVTVENLSSENGADITPVWFGLHDGSFDTFEVGESASSGVMHLAEDAITGLEGTVSGVVDTLIEMGLDPEVLPPQENTLGAIFADSSAAENGGTQGLVVSAESPLGIAPGDSLSVTTDIDINNLANNRFFNYGAMFFPSNDAFVANNEALELFDAEGNFIGEDIIVTRNNVWDAGTEVNDENPNNVPFTLDVIGNGIDENGTVQSHQGFQAPGSGGVLDFRDGVFANADFTTSDAPIARISINPVINGTAENDLIFGSSNRERIRGFEGNDLIFGEYGDDTIEGGAGDDLLWGKSGADQFVLRTTDGQDTIFDYEDGVDSFVLAGGLEFDDLTITQGVGQVWLEITNTGEDFASLIGVNASDIGIEDFTVTVEL
ncbi:MAG: spondin domain-containing protein [Cyanobacteria bacterium P01_A01_bin.83]